MSSPLISFCIPTLNRGTLLQLTLENLAFHVQGFNVEYVIVDGGSIDNTEEIVSNFSIKYPQTKYFKRSSSVGIDVDILKSVELASGKYCWLMSDDDGLEDGSFLYIINILKNNLGIAGISTNIQAYDCLLQFRIKTVPSISRNLILNDFLFKDKEYCFKNLCIHFGFISAQIINRDIWLSAICNKNLTPFCNSWIIIYVIGEMLNINSNWYYVHKKCIKYRSGNDSFSSRLGIYGRQLITHENFNLTLRSQYPVGSQVYDYIINSLLYDRVARTLCVIKSNNISYKLQYRLLKLYMQFYSKNLIFWVYIFPIFFIPNSLFSFTKFLYFKYKNILWKLFND
jgi:abequosyltransferase